MANQPDRFALFILGPNEKRVEVVADTHIANAATFVLNKEDHTMGNMLRHAVLSVPGVLFSGYRVPHPLEPRTVLKIQTDGTLTPVQALKMGCEKVISQIGQIRSSFKAQCQLFEDQGQIGITGGAGSSSATAAAMAGTAGVGNGTGYANGYGGGGYGGYGDYGQRDEEGTGYVDI